MHERDWLAERFEQQRPRLRAVAYRMLGSLTEADDRVQETWLRLSHMDAGEVENLAGWLTTVVAKVSLNMLRSRKVRREEPLPLRRDRAHRRPLAGDGAAARPAVRAAASMARTRFPTPTSKPSAEWSTRFSPPTWSAGRVAGGPGGEAVARQSLSYSQLGLVVRPVLINGVAGAVTFLEGRPSSIGAATVRGGKIVEIDILADPERLLGST